jgi:hypothetical protein
MNRLDMQLVAGATKQLWRRFEMTPERAEGMASLRRRCEALQSAGPGARGAYRKRCKCLLVREHQ